MKRDHIRLGIARVDKLPEKRWSTHGNPTHDKEGVFILILLGLTFLVALFVGFEICSQLL